MGELDDATIRRALGAAFPDLPIERCTFIGQGWDSQAWEVNDALIFRFPKRPEVADWLRREIALLPALAPALPAAIPCFTHVAATGSPLDPALPFIGYPVLRGTFLDQALDLLTPHAPLIADLSDFLGALHSFPPGRAIDCGLPPGTWPSWVAHWRAFVADVARGADMLGPELHGWAVTFLQSFLAELMLAERPVTVIHHDLALEHILVDPSGPHLTGVIDWGDVAIGDAALDFAGFFGAGCPAVTLAALFAAYPRPLDDGFRRRAAWYARLAPFHLFTFGLHIADPAMIAQGVAAIRELRAFDGGG